jgi:hypothetical protein
VIDTSTHTPVPVAYDIATTTEAVNRDYAGTTSDGLTQLDTTRTLRDYTGAPTVHPSAAVRN